MNLKQIYKKTENASVEIVISRTEDYFFFGNLLQEFSRLGILRITFLTYFINEEKMYKLYVYANKMGICLFFKLKFKDYINFSKNYKLPIIIYDMKIASIETEPRDNIFYELKYSVEDAELIKDLIINDISENYILNPYGELTNLDNYQILINSFIDNFSEKDLYFVPIIFPVDLIRSHPCNVYLCSGSNCHSGHGKSPRYIYIDSNKNVIFFPIELKIGNLTENTFSDILNGYLGSKDFKRFIDVSKKLYIDILDRYFYSTIAWFEWVKKFYV